MAATAAQQKAAAVEQEEVEHGPFPIEHLQVLPRPPHRNPSRILVRYFSPDVVLKVEPYWGFLFAWRMIGAGLSRFEVAARFLGCRVVRFLGEEPQVLDSILGRPQMLRIF